MIFASHLHGLLQTGASAGVACWNFALPLSGGGGGGAFCHKTVLGAELTEFLQPAPGRTFLDLTLGGGGHSERLLAAGASVVGVDRDPAAREAATQRLSRFGDRFCVCAGNFAHLEEMAREQEWSGFDGIALDLGVSSPQVDHAERGFSFHRDGPLDMRMGDDTGQTAADLVNSLSEQELTELFRRLGEEPKARAAARAIVSERQKEAILRTGHLADCLERALGRRSGRHPGTRVFQALRIAVNGELDALEAVLPAAVPLLKPGARLAVITFHSLEDRMVKRFIRSHSREEIDRPEWPAPRPNPACYFRDLARRPILPSEAEVTENPRARSAKLRVGERRQA